MHINRPRHDDYAPEGSGMAAVALGMMSALPLIGAAILTGKPLWSVLVLWFVGGPVLALIFALLPYLAPRPNRGASHV
ncbi:hypothetical protein [Pseudodonghicola flavimaris]|uniref:Uncharacterized protein n=1 Tax=Pseudodonghicola flavimaris TaxID=3050036 RepID=A0ABT7F432_9RHOB|nr:hypothetical protein [Pseudodonghicola flavimaris]MDK3019374.1 hypothetical protein [Pseudodonghicola flavimaris]